jgi:hypothetical protein
VGEARASNGGIVERKLVLSLFSLFSPLLFLLLTFTSDRFIIWI